MVEQMQQQQRQTRNTPSTAPPAQPPPAAQPSAPSAGPGGFQTQVTPGAGNDPIGAIIGQPGSGAQTPPPSLPQATGGDASAKQLYETAYGLLLAQDYGAAEAAFEEFLKRFPNDQLAGNAQYWLGETFYVRGNFKSAAGAFLKGYQTYARSSKAPDSLLKLAMSLDRLGQRDAACQSFSELNTRYPNAPGAVRSRADNERRRLGCP
jgi:tol-pal system protein YbgF